MQNKQCRRKLTKYMKPVQNIKVCRAISKYEADQNECSSAGYSCAKYKGLEGIFKIWSCSK